VSTGEVADAVGSFAGIKECNVYGVTVPGYDGRAGMASIVLDYKHGEGECKSTGPSTFGSDASVATTVTTPAPDVDFDFVGFYAHIRLNLAPFQQPLFIRFSEEMPITTTFKHRKVEFVSDGFDPSRARDALYFRDDSGLLSALASRSSSSGTASGDEPSARSRSNPRPGFVRLTPALYTLICNSSSSSSASTVRL